MISVCIPTFNGEKFIAEQLRTILTQIGPDDEIIISDDGSTDNTLAIIASFNDTRIRIVQHTKINFSTEYRYMYTTQNLEHALMHAQGEYIYMADQDDLWVHNKIEVVQQLLQQYTLVCTDCTVIDSNGVTLERSYFDWNNSGKGIGRNLIKNSYLGCCMAFRRELLVKILPISAFKVPHDIWIGLISECTGSVYFESQQLVLYRRHSSNLSPSGEKVIIVYCLSSIID